LADDRTLLGGPEPTLKKMLEAKDARSPLRDRLPKVALDHDVIAIFVMDQTERKEGQGPPVRQALGEILKAAKENIPPNFEGADKLADQIAAATLNLDLGGDTLISLDVEATDESVAASIHDLTKNGLDLVKAAVPTLKQQLKTSVPADFAKPASTLLDQLVNGTSLAKDGSHVVLTIKMPEDLPSLIEKLGAMWKDFASMPQTKPIPKGGPLPKGKTQPKGGKK
jgi:hypothetical protein